MMSKHIVRCDEGSLCLYPKPTKYRNDRCDVLIYLAGGTPGRNYETLYNVQQKQTR